MESILYHGSNHTIEQPLYGLGKTTNDYGRGFYCTRELELAKEWGCAGGLDGFANEYVLERADELSVLRLNEEPYNILNWLAILAEHRTYWQRGSVSAQAKRYLHDNFLVDTSDYDVIVGYRANDSYFSFAQAFVANGISLRQLSQAMRLGRLGEQVVLMSREAFEHLQFRRSIPAPGEIYFAKKTERDQAARREYRRLTQETNLADDIFMLDIMREGMRSDDPRLRG